MRLHQSRSLILSLFLAALAFLAFYSQHSNAQEFGFAPVQGQILDGRTGRPAPGLMVSLVHPVLGRSAPAYTGPNGQFGWGAIPIRPEQYFLEVYWGPKLIFRQPLMVRGYVLLPPLRL